MLERSNSFELPDPAKPLLRRSETSSTWEPSEPHPALERCAKVANWVERFCVIQDKQSKLHLIRFNAIQEILLQYIAWCWLHEIPVRVVTPKSRKLGSSTFWDLWLYATCELFKGHRGAIVCHDEAGANQLFSIVETVKRGLSRSAWQGSALINDQGALYKWSSGSALWSETIKTGDALGKGGTPNSVHYSEVANYSDKRLDAKKAINSIKNAVGWNAQSIEVYESTAKGQDPVFFEICELARDPNSGINLQLIFLPWLLDPTHSMTWEDYRKDCLVHGKHDPGDTFEPTEDEQTLRAFLESTEVKPHERLYRYQHRLTDEQLIWRRWAIPNLTHNDVDEFRRYYPCYLEECFTASSRSAFTSETINHYRQISRPAPFTGQMDHFKFVSFAAGNLKIWEHPMPHMGYVVGVDVGGTAPKADPSCAYVVQRGTLRVVAAYHGKPEWDELAEQVYQIAAYYNTALLVIENNYQPAVVNYVFRKNYKNLYCAFRDAQHDAVAGKVPGFNTNSKTRPELLAILIRACRELVPEIWDPGFWREMETFVWCPRPTAINPEMDGTYRAVGANKDDRIIALGIALLQCYTIAAEGPMVVPEKFNPAPSSAFQMFTQMRNEKKRRLRDSSTLL